MPSISAHTAQYISKAAEASSCGYSGPSTAMETLSGHTLSTVVAVSFSALFALSKIPNI